MTLAKKPKETEEWKTFILLWTGAIFFCMGFWYGVYELVRKLAVKLLEVL